MSKVYFINNLERGQTIEEVFGINTFKQAKDRNNRPYIDLELVDKTGTIKGKVWSDNISNIDNNALSEGSVVRIKGLVTEFNGSLQLSLYALSLHENYDLEDFLPVTTRKIEAMWDEFLEYINSVQDKTIEQLLNALVEKYEDKIKNSPAGKSVHHNYVGGLLEHIVEMLNLSEVICKLYPEANKNIVIAGIMFHDIGKIRELFVDGFRIDYTAEGKLIGHIPLGLKIFNEIEQGVLKENTKLQIEHIILSHHYTLEFGSPVTPRTIEAVIVSKIDDLSSKVRLVQKILINNADSNSEFAPKEFGIDGEIYLGVSEQNL